MTAVPRPPLRVWVWTAAACAIVLAAVLLWRGSDAAATDSTTSAPPEVPTGEPAADLAEAWSAGGGPLPGSVVEEGRVLLGGAHGISARDVVTGDEAWHYTRANARLCDLTAVDGVVVAVFSTGGWCDEAIALDAATGARVWTRSVGFRPEVRLASTDQLALAVSRNGVVVLDPTGNGIRWTERVPDGCRILDADVGDTGVGLIQRCRGDLTLRLFDGFDGTEHWSRELDAPAGTGARLAGVDTVLTVVVDDRLVVHEAEGGDVLRTHDLPSGDVEDEELHAAPVGSLVLVWVRGSLRALGTDDGEERWSVPAAGLPPVPVVSQVVPGAAELLVPGEDGFVRRDVATGEETARLPVEGGLAEGGRATLVGPVVVYRLPDRVAAYR